MRTRNFSVAIGHPSSLTRKAVVGIFSWLTWALVLSPAVYGQYNRITDHNRIGWYVYNGGYQLGRMWQLHTEYQWRRTDLIRQWQQSLAG